MSCHARMLAAEIGAESYAEAGPRRANAELTIALVILPERRSDPSLDS